MNVLIEVAAIEDSNAPERDGSVEVSDRFGELVGAQLLPHSDRLLTSVLAESNEDEEPA